MDIYQIQIIEPGAKRLLDDRAELDLISIRSMDEQSDINPADRCAEIMSLARTWRDMSETDFSEYLSGAKGSGK